MNEHDNEPFSIGGSASNNGVEFQSDNFVAKFVMDKSGSYEVTHEERLELGAIRDVLYRIPILKGLLSLVDYKPLYTVPIIGLIVLDIMRSTVFVVAVNSYVLITLLVISGVTLLACLAYVTKTILFKMKSTWMFHGAEHKTIYAYETGSELTLENVRACPRIAKRCGTNIAIFYVFFFAIFWFVIDISSVRFIGAYVLAYELFDLRNGDRYPVIKVFFKLGQFCQQRLFTKEPTDIQITASIETVNKLIELESKRENGNS